MARIEAPAMPATVSPIEPGTVWLTYAELAERIGITGDSARNLVRRKRWLRRPGNDGVQRIGVPTEYLAEREAEPPTHGADDAPTIPPAMEGIEAPTVAAMEAHIATLREMVAKAEVTAAHHGARADAAEARAQGERERADRIAAELHELAQRFAASTDEGRAREATAADRLETVRAEMAALRARPWWRRLAG